MVKTVNTRIQTKRDSFSNWEVNNPVLLDGEEILVDTTNGEIRRKIGDGTTSYNDLPFADESIRTLINNTLQDAKDYSDSLIGSEQFAEKYSSTEIVSGQWIDGRPIYRRTLTFSANNDISTSKNWVRYYLSSSEQAEMNLDFYINIRGMVKASSVSTTATGSWQPVPRICPDAVEEYSIGLGDLTSTAVGVLFGSSYTAISVMYLTIDYVKKTS